MEETIEKQIEALASKVYGYFEKKTRNNGEEFWSIKDKKDKQWVVDLCRKAHADMLPDDYKYLFIIQSLDYISEGATPDNPPEYSEEVYTNKLLKWLSSNLERVGYCDEVLKEFGGDHRGITDIIGLGYRKEQEEVFYSVYQSLSDHVVTED